MIIQSMFVRFLAPPHEMSLVQTAFGMCARHTTSKPSRQAFVKIARNLLRLRRRERRRREMAGKTEMAGKKDVAL